MRREMSLLVSCLLLALLGAGCAVQIQEQVFVTRTGAGKITVSYTFKEDMVEAFGEMLSHADPEDKAKPKQPQAGHKGKSAQRNKLAFVEKLFQDTVDNAQGMVAWTRPKVTSSAKKITVTTSGYFDAIDKVKLYNVKSDAESGKQKKVLTFAARWERTPAGATLYIDNGATREMATISEDMTKKAKAKAGRKRGAKSAGSGEDDWADNFAIEMMKPMLEQMRFSFSIELPGPVVEVSPFLERRGQRSELLIQGKDITAAIADPKGAAAKRLATIGRSQMKIAWKHEAAPSPAEKAFASELAEAKKSWSRVHPAKN